MDFNYIINNEDEVNNLIPAYYSFTGVVTERNNMWNNQGEVVEDMMYLTLENEEGGIVNFVISPDTYFLDCGIIEIGSVITGYYRSDMPVPMIYPPRYQARVITFEKENRNIKVDHFNEFLVSQDNMLSLQVSNNTWVTLENGGRYCENIGDKDLVVLYGASTRSIPAITVPFVIIVLT